jgi:LemA protein
MKIILCLILIFLIIIIFIYNKLVGLKNNANNSKSVIDVYLQQRFDLIPNLIEATKGYMNYEKETLEKITYLRAIYKEKKDETAGNELNSAYNTIIATSENYPELKANEHFLNLQKSLVKIESQLQAARRIYNNDVTKYNTKIAIFPNNIMAKLLKFKPLNLFSLEGDSSVVVKFL